MPHRPDAPDALIRAGFQHHQSGRLKEAEAAYKRALRGDSGHPDANNLLGLLCIQTRRFDEAVKRIRRPLQVQPDDPQAHYNLGLALKDLGRLDEAALHFRQCIALAPQNAQAHNALGNVLKGLGRLDEAVTCLETALSLQPADPTIGLNLADALNDLGVDLNKRGETDEAIARFRQSAVVAPTNVNAHINLGITLEQTGRADEAAACFVRAVQIKPDFAEAHFHLAHLRNRASSAEEVHAMETLCTHPDSSDEQRIFLAFGLGRACEKRQRYDEAFEHFHAGHSLKKKSSSFDLGEAAKHVDALMQTFDAAFFERNQNAGCDDAAPIFIVGMPRSGTTLTEQILASHPQVHGGGELAYVSRIVKAAEQTAQRPFPRGCEKLDAGIFRSLGAHYLREIEALASDAARITDTTPMNFLNIGLIAAMLPKAPIVHCRRDPMDTCLSIFMHPLSRTHAYAHDLTDLGGYYRLYENLMDHWRTVLPGRIYDLDYERVVADSEKEIRALLAFCVLPFEKACLAFHETDRVIRTPSASQVRRPIHSDSVGRWKRYEKRLGALKAALGRNPP